MTIKYQLKDLSAFFGAEIDTASGISDESWSVDYSGSLLNYSFHFREEDEIVAISSAVDHPFGGDSIFEFNVPCNVITVCDDGYYPGETGLMFWHGEVKPAYENMTMMLLKRPDGDLKVWPNLLLPPGHPLFKG